MARLYDATDEAACPGEQNCQTWQSSAPDSPVRCPGCPKHNASSDGIESETFEEEQLLDRVERLRRERDSGRTNIYSTVTPEEWKALQLFDEQHEARHIAHDLRIAGLFEVMMSLLAR